jgi:lipopolysaccharide assembly outer membrane protein LptD (OstA)
VQGQTILTADWVVYSRGGSRGVASGNVVFSDGVDTVYSNFVEFNLSTLQGVLFLAEFDDTVNRFRLQGDEIVKTGDQTYTFERGMFTTCRCPDEGEDPWQIRAESANLELDGYAVARNTTINILGVPILWLPWMAYPLKSERESGFLFPEVAYRGRNGIAVGLPYFWAAAENLNVTVTPQWLEKRGFKGDLEVEYLLGEHSEGTIYGSYIHDDAIDEDSLDDPFDADRWAVHGAQSLHLPQGWQVQSEFKVVSDNRYPSDFRELSRFRRDRYLTSTVFGTKHFGDNGLSGFVGAAHWADDIQSPDNQDRDPYLLQRLPDLEFKVLPSRLSWAERLVPSLDGEYIYFAQEQNPSEVFPNLTPLGDDMFYDTGIDALPDEQEPGFQAGIEDPHEDNVALGGPEGDLRFQEGEPLADRGHRLLITPRLAMPWRFGNHFEIYPEIGWRQSFYQTRAQGFEAWGTFTARADIQTRLSRSYRGDLIHILEPRLGYGLITHPDLDDQPFFVPFTAVPQQRIRQLDLDNVTRDTADRLDSFNGITWGASNRLYRRGGPGVDMRLLADITVSAQYDFANGGRLGNFVIDGVGMPSERSQVRLNIGFDPEDVTLDELLAEADWMFGSSLGLALSYRYLEQIPRFFEDFRFDSDRFDDFQNSFNRVNQVNARVRYAFTKNWSARYQIAYAFENSILLANSASVEYLSKCVCWGLGVEVRQNRQFGFEFNVIYRIVGLGNDPTGLSEGGLDQFGFLDAF